MILFVVFWYLSRIMCKAHGTVYTGLHTPQQRQQLQRQQQHWPQTTMWACTALWRLGPHTSLGYRQIQHAIMLPTRVHQSANQTGLHSFET